ncbi:ATPase family AAA domain-containing protein FIGL1 [Linum perenne]
MGNSRDASLSWRKQVDDNLNRLHSLKFGADLALEKGDFSTSYVLGLRLIGFLDSHSLSDADEALIRPIRREALSNLDSSRRTLVPESDRRAFERAGRDPGLVFGSKLDMDVEKIKQSKYFRALLQQYNVKTPPGSGNQLDEQQKVSCKPLKVPTQAKLTSLYGNNITKAHGRIQRGSLAPKSKMYEDCMIVDNPPSYTNPRGMMGLTNHVNIEEEEKVCGNPMGSKRSYVEIRSPRNDNPKSPACNKESNMDGPGDGFVTARAKLEMEVRQKKGLTGSPNARVSPQTDNINRGYGARSYGYSRRGIRGNFVPPIRSNGVSGNMSARVPGKNDDTIEDSTKRCMELLCGPDGELPEKLRNLEPRLIEHVSNEIMDRDPNVHWNDIAGLDHAKKCVNEMVIWPLMRPDIFRGCRSPGKGLLLFGPPGTGKTMIGKAIAGEAKATFFYISASSLTSKWIGEGEKLVRALFGVACCRQPAVIFVDEIDSLLSQRKSEGEHESSRRLKTQFLIEMEGFDSGSEQILLIGATNRPQELDEAARRRLTKRLYIPLPSSEARAWIVRNLLEKDGLFKFSQEEIDTICNLTEGYSGSDMKNLVKDASMGPLREALGQGTELTKLKKEDMRPVTLQDFENAIQEVRPSVSPTELGVYDDWNKQFGSLSLN